MKEKLFIFDTTLRDGAQTYGVDFNVDEKKILASKLDALGVDYIEGGWPGANETDSQFFSEKMEFKNSTFTAFGMTKKTGRSAENDPGLAAIINVSAPSACVVGKSWDFHVVSVPLSSSTIPRFSNSSLILSASEKSLFTLAVFL